LFSKDIRGKIMCRKVVFFLSMLLFINSFAQFAGGSGTYEDPWLIRTPENLDSIRFYLGTDNDDKYFKQIADIDLGVAPWNEETGWEPIGRDTISYNNFMASYEGNNFSIKNLYINRPDLDYIGLFGYLNEYCAIQNITLRNVNITGGNKVGAIAGYTDFAGFTKCFVTGNITGKNEIGGFIGKCNGIIIFNSWCNAIVNGLKYVGGLIGKTACMPYTYIYKSYSKSNVTGFENTGGLIGHSENPNIVFSYWDIETSGQLTSAGGEGRTTVEMTCDFSSETYKYWDFSNTWSEDFESKNNGYPFLMNSLSPLVPGAPSNLTSSCGNGQYSIKLSWNNPDTLLDGNPVTELTAVHVYRNFDLIYTINSPLPGNSESYSDIVALTGNYTYKVIGVNSNGYGINARINQPAGDLFADGSGTQSDPYIVSNAEHLNNIRYYTGKDSICFKQTDTINLGVAPWNEGKGWIPIGHDESEFKGSYESNKSNLISGLTINDSTRIYTSLFGAVRNAIIDHVHLYNVNISGKAGCGSLTGASLFSMITNCSAEFGSVEGVENEIGGLIGSSLGDSISCCYSTCSVSGLDHIGGLIGLIWLNTLVSDCYSQGKVSGSDYVGGLIGVNDESYIKNCYSTGFVSGNTTYTGGLQCGFSTNTVNSYWNTETSGQSTSAGGEGKTTSEMWNYDTYIDWDFENIWQKHYQSGHPDYPVLFWQSVGIEDDTNSIPSEFTLEQNYPNPFNPTTNISYSLPQGFSGVVKLSVYNANGQLVKELFHGKQTPGNHSVEFNASELNSGLYIYRLETTKSILSKKMILLK